MKKSHLIWGAVAVAAVIASMFAPAPVTRTVDAQSSNACPGLMRAYQACRANNPDPSQCQHIREQIFAHGCAASSGSGSASR